MSSPKKTKPGPKSKTTPGKYELLVFLNLIKFISSDLTVVYVSSKSPSEEDDSSPGNVCHADGDG